MRYFYTLLTLCCVFEITIAQNTTKKALDHSVYDSWKRINEATISEDGNWATYSLQPQLGDATLEIYDIKQSKTVSITRGVENKITQDASYVAFKIKPHLDSLKNQRRRKLTDDKLTKDSLGIYNLSNKELEKIARVKSFIIPEKWSGWLAYHKEVSLPTKDTTVSDSLKAVQKALKKESAETGTQLVLRDLNTKNERSFPFVLNYSFAEEGQKLIFSSSGNDSAFLAGVYVFDIKEEKLIALHRSLKGKYSQLIFDKKGNQAAFLADLDTTKTLIRNQTLFYWKHNELDSALVMADSSTTGTPESWIVNGNYEPFFSENGNRLFFGSSPKPLLQDTSLLPEEIVNVEVWHFQDQRLQTQQNFELETDKKKSYLAVAHLDSKKIIQLGTKETPDIMLGDEGNSDFALGTSKLPYMATLTWEGFPPYHDIYKVNLSDGTKSIVKKKVKTNPQISPKGKFFYWYQVVDSAWFTYQLATDQVLQISNNKKVKFYNELSDYPDYPRSYGTLGWHENDESIYIYDRYDIWKIDPENKTQPINITKSGRSQKKVFRYIKLDPEERFLSDKQNLLLHVFDEKDKSHAYYSYTLGSNKYAKQLLKGSFKFSYPIKSKKKNQLIFTMENFNTFPDYYTSDLNFKKVKKVSFANLQQEKYLWGSVELFKWTSLDGIPLEGLLYKPENFDPSKKYPMLVNFYERESHNLNEHHAPEPHRSTANKTFYTSRGYVVFVPDVVYRPGYPGESCYNSVIPGVTKLIDQGFIDPDAIGVQGHSWGGYQIAYLITKTNIFKAAESGAPVSNMISAYGGIRWGSGLSRMFQYEHTQSRIGGTIWSHLLRYIENSPIFFLDKVQTPVLIMHNDQDGAVPWTQGIEFFVGLRRLGKPSWMLNYSGEPHWPLKYQLRKDFNIRMQQYFDHYLKGATIPRWMKSGIPAIEKSINLGYELEDN